MLVLAWFWFCTPMGMAACANLSPAQAQRASMLESLFRCPVCQTENIADSTTSLAGQLRQIIQQQVLQGQSNQQIKHYMVQRYGDFILLKPPASPLTSLLYASPFLALCIGAGLFYFSRQHQPNLPAALTLDEQARLDALLK